MPKLVEILQSLKKKVEASDSKTDIDNVTEVFEANLMGLQSPQEAPRILARIFDDIVTPSGEYAFIDEKELDGLDKEYRELFNTVKLSDSKKGLHADDLKRVEAFRDKLVWRACREVLGQNGNLDPAIIEALNLQHVIQVLGADVVRNLVIRSAVAIQTQLIVAQDKVAAAVNLTEDKKMLGLFWSRAFRVDDATLNEKFLSATQQTIKKISTQKIMEQLSGTTAFFELHFFPDLKTDFGHVAGSISYQDHIGGKINNNHVYLSYGGSSRDITVRESLMPAIEFLEKKPHKVEQRKFYFVKEAGSHDWQLYRGQASGAGLDSAELHDFILSEKTPLKDKIRAVLPQNIAPSKMTADAKAEVLHFFTNEQKLLDPAKYLKDEEEIYARKAITIRIPVNNGLAASQAANKLLDGKKLKDYSFLKNNCAHAMLNFMHDAKLITDKQYADILGITGIVKPVEIAQLGCHVSLNYDREMARSIENHFADDDGKSFKKLISIHKNILKTESKLAEINKAQDKKKQLMIQHDILAEVSSQLDAPAYDKAFELLRALTVTNPSLEKLLTLFPYQNIPMFVEKKHVLADIKADLSHQKIPELAHLLQVLTRHVKEDMKGVVVLDLYPQVISQLKKAASLTNETENSKAFYAKWDVKLGIEKPSAVAASEQSARLKL